MGRTDDPRYRYQRARERIDEAVGDGRVAEGDAEAVKEVLDALDADNPAYVFQVNGSTETKTNNTLASYAQRLRMASAGITGSLFEQDTDSINQLMGRLATGDHTLGPSDGYANNTLGNYQSALKAFYRYHDGHNVDPEEIPVAAGDATSVDSRDMFTQDEVDAMRDVIDHPRERCMFELLANTGQRIRVIQTLRIRDVDVADGIFWLNDDADGLKGASGKRPLLGAGEYVHQWLEYHPTGDPEDALITSLPKNGGGGKAGEQLTQRTIQYHLNRIADDAGIDKDVHPHIFRHYFTTIAKRDYGMDDAHIKRLRGDAPGSNVMETTYQHLTDEDSIEHAKAKHEGREPETESPLTPQVCPTCKTELDHDAKACGRCGAVFSPDAKAAQDMIEAQEREAKEQADTLEEYKDVDQVADLLQSNPEFAAELMNKLGDMAGDE